MTKKAKIACLYHAGLCPKKRLKARVAVLVFIVGYEPPMDVRLCSITRLSYVLRYRIPPAKVMFHAGDKLCSIRRRRRRQCYAPDHTGSR